MNLVFRLNMLKNLMELVPREAAAEEAAAEPPPTPAVVQPVALANSTLLLLPER